MNGKMGQPSEEIPPPFASTTAGSNSLNLEAMEINDDSEERSSEDSFWASVVVVNCSEDILKKLIPYAAEEEIFILGASGEVSYVELVNPQEAPVANTVLQGSFSISAIEGNIVWPGNLENKKSQVNVLVAGSDGRIRGGPVRTLIAKSSIKVFVSTTSKDDVHEMVPLFQFHEHAKRMADVVDQIYKATLKDLNTHC